MCNKISVFFTFLKVFSWVAAVLADRVFKRIWVAEENGLRNTEQMYHNCERNNPFYYRDTARNWFY